MESVTAVIDGDTFKTENRTVRLIDVYASELNTDIGSLVKRVKIPVSLARVAI